MLRRGTTIGLSRAVVMDDWEHPDDARPMDGSCYTYGPPHAGEALIRMQPRTTDRDGRGTPIPVADKAGVSPLDPAE